MQDTDLLSSRHEVLKARESSRVAELTYCVLRVLLKVFGIDCLFFLEFAHFCSAVCRVWRLRGKRQPGRLFVEELNGVRTSSVTQLGTNAKECLKIKTMPCLKANWEN